MAYLCAELCECMFEARDLIHHLGLLLVQLHALVLQLPQLEHIAVLVVTYIQSSVIYLVMHLSLRLMRWRAYLLKKVSLHLPLLHLLLFLCGFDGLPLPVLVAHELLVQLLEHAQHRLHLGLLVVQRLGRWNQKTVHIIYGEEAKGRVKRMT